MVVLSVLGSIMKYCAVDGLDSLSGHLLPLDIPSCAFLYLAFKARSESRPGHPTVPM